MEKLYGKIIIEGTIQVVTGLHIGTSGDFSAIGAVDNIVIRDKVSKKPMIPGSSLKGKMRFLLSRTKYNENEIDEMPEIAKKNQEIKRLFGTSSPDIVLSRLQFQDCVLSEDSAAKLQKLDLDLPYTEIKYENTIDRIKGKATPRQQERVPAGAEFDFKLTYNIENEEDLQDDIQNVALMMELLEDDYLGGHGTRGYGRVKFNQVNMKLKQYTEESKAQNIDMDSLNQLIEKRGN